MVFPFHILSFPCHRLFNNGTLARLPRNLCWWLSLAACAGLSSCEREGSRWFLRGPRNVRASGFAAACCDPTLGCVGSFQKIHSHFLQRQDFSVSFNCLSWAWKYIQLADVAQAVLLEGSVRGVILCSDVQSVTLFLSHFSSCLPLSLSSQSFSIQLLRNTFSICFACYRKIFEILSLLVDFSWILC